MLASNTETSLELRTGHFYLIMAPRPEGRAMMNAFAARLALTGPVLVLDGGNAFDAFSIARQVYRSTAQYAGAGSPETVLGRLQVARAFTCYQMVAMLEKLPGSRQAVLVLDLLATFCDESVALAERYRLLDQATTELKRLSRTGPLAVSAAATQVETDIANLPFGHPAQFGAPTAAMLARLEDAADQALYYAYPQVPLQGRLL